MRQGVGWHHFFYMLQDDICATYRNIYTQFFEEGLISWISDAGYSPWHFKFMLSHLAGNQIIFIITSYCDKHISTSGPHVIQTRDRKPHSNDHGRGCAG